MDSFVVEFWWFDGFGSLAFGSLSLIVWCMFGEWFLYPKEVFHFSPSRGVSNFCSGVEKQGIATPDFSMPIRPSSDYFNPFYSFQLSSSLVEVVLDLGNPL
ncbi:hypothetical protein GIB67_035360 [Kingdonia uniflora]|uniref:Uncharacterized protein n=1 Tax=Kingdonia uniflora TaxID=39325 RepID=A0A7J7NSS3_9MAGN|nr:hypothetical protein GIB67_035360 [Kingdonia uniflora]